MSLRGLLAVAFVVIVAVVRCAAEVQPTDTPSKAPREVLAVPTFLADIAQNVAGDRLKVSALLPVGVDPHAFEPTPGDLARVAQSDLIIVNGAGFEEFLGGLLDEQASKGKVVEASAGLEMRGVPEAGHEEGKSAEDGHGYEGDPHFWLDPNYAIKYVENIRDALSGADPDGARTYSANAQAYIAQLKELDGWIREQVRQVPPEQRQLVTNHESLGYFANRYGFKVIGTIFPGTSTSAAPSAQQVVQLVDRIKATGTKAIFLETGSSTLVAQQVAGEVGIRVVTQLYTHSITEAGGPAPSYIEMMKYNTRVIVEALR